MGENSDSNREPIVPQTIFLPIEIFPPNAGAIRTLNLEDNTSRLPITYSILRMMHLLFALIGINKVILIKIIQGIATTYLEKK